MKRLGPFFAITFFILAISATSSAQILAWDTQGVNGGIGTFNSTTTNANLNPSVLSRGAGLQGKSRANTYNSENFTLTTLLADAITNNDYYQFTVSAQSGFKVSMGTLDANLFRDGNGPQRFQWQYSLNGFATAGVNIGSEIVITTNPASGTATPSISLAGISALQNVPSGTTITMRLYGYGALGNGGDGAFGLLAGNDLAIAGATSLVTEATVSDFKATNVDGNTVLEWHTGFEVENLGFNIYRQQKGKRVQINPSLIAGSSFLVGPNMPMTAGDIYSWIDPTTKTTSIYYLESIDLRGTRTLHGPIVPVSSSSRDIKPSRKRAMMLSEINEFLTEDKAKATQKGPSPAQRGLAADFGAGEASFSPAGETAKSNLKEFIPPPGAARISVKTAAWYRVTHADLTGIGFDTSVDPKTIQLFDNGEEVPILLNQVNKNVFAPGDSFEFYGHGLDTPSTDTNVYWLVGGVTKGLRINFANNSINASTKATSFPYTLELEERLFHVPTVLNGEKENFFGRVIFADVNQNLFVEKLSPPATGTALLEVALQGYNFVNHSVKVKLNGQDLGTLNFANQEYKTAQLAVPYSLLSEGLNTLTFQKLGGPADVSLVDFARLTYERSYIATGNILFFSAQQNVMIDGFTNANIKVMEITDPLNVKEISHAVGASTLGFKTVVHTGNPGYFVAFTSDAAQSPFLLELDTVSNLHSLTNSANLVVISYAAFSSSLAPLVTLRQSQGLTVKVVDVQDVYDEFSDGEHSPFALRDFLKFAKENWQGAPTFALMAGDASLDPRNYLGFGNTDYVPSKLIDTAFLEAGSDDWLVDFNNDGLPDMAIGRLPVNSATETSQLVAKIVGYNPAANVQKVLFVIDRNNVGDGFTFLQVSQDAAVTLPFSLSVDTLDRTLNTDGVLRTLILNAIAQKPLVVNYFGHGSVEIWANAAVFNTGDMPALDNDSLPVWLMMTCLNGYFHNANRTSLAEALIRRNPGGAAAVWASSGMTDVLSQLKLNKQLYLQFFSNPGITLGEAAKNAKQSSVELDVRRTWILFGDPTMKLQ